MSPKWCIHQPQIKVIIYKTWRQKMQSLTCHRMNSTTSTISVYTCHSPELFNFFAVLPMLWFRIRIPMPIYMKTMKQCWIENIQCNKIYYKNQRNDVKTYIFHKINAICGIHNCNRFIKLLWPICPHYFPHCICYSLQFKPRRSLGQWSVVHVLTTCFFWCYHNITLKKTLKYYSLKE